MPTLLWYAAYVVAVVAGWESATWLIHFIDSRVGARAAKRRTPAANAHWRKSLLSLRDDVRGIRICNPETIEALSYNAACARVEMLIDEALGHIITQAKD